MDFAYNLTNNPHKTFIYNSSGIHTLTLPRGITMVQITMIGTGGGGGGGVSDATGQAGGGGGGAGTSPTGVGGAGGRGGDGLVIIQCW